MATRSNIAILKPADSKGKHVVEFIYCHWDGYPDGVGKTLQEYYQDTEKVEKLIKLGDISFLEKEVDIPEGVIHSFEAPAPGITVAYGRDRGESGTKAQILSIEFSELKKVRQEEYLYVFVEEEKKWLQF